MKNVVQPSTLRSIYCLHRGSSLRDSASRVSPSIEPECIEPAMQYKIVMIRRFILILCLVLSIEPGLCFYCLLLGIQFYVVLFLEL